MTEIDDDEPEKPKQGNYVAQLCPAGLDLCKVRQPKAKTKTTRAGSKPEDVEKYWKIKSVVKTKAKANGQRSAMVKWDGINPNTGKPWQRGAWVDEECLSADLRVCVFDDPEIPDEQEIKKSKSVKKVKSAKRRNVIKKAEAAKKTDPARDARKKPVPTKCHACGGPLVAHRTPIIARRILGGPRVSQCINPNCKSRTRGFTMT